jgi:acetylornithine deacetylase/succinyl-diaminopimelate desuccinylase-like protein
MIDTVDLLRALIRNRCVNDGTPGSGGERRSVETIADALGRSGVLFEPVPGRLSAVYRIAGTDPSAPSLMLMGHTDVVPVSPDGWSHDPFAAEIHDGFVWGRGAVDMLNLTAAMTVAFAPYLSGDREPLPGDLVFLAVADEENAGGLGAGPLTRNRWDLVGCDYLLTEIAYPRFSSDGGAGYPVSVGEKGPHWSTLRSTGVPGHGSVPYGSINALEPMAAALAGIFSAPPPAVVSDEWRAFVHALDLDAPSRGALLDPERVDGEIDRLAASDANLAAYIHACTHMTVSPNVVAGGVKANMVPDAAEAQVDVRTLPGQSRADVDGHLRKAMGAAADSITIEPTADHPASSSRPDGPLWAAIVDSIEDLTGSRRVIPTITPATTDARFFRARGTVAYGVGLFDDRVEFPEFLSMFHGNNERVSVESVHQTVALLTRILERWREASTA